MAFVSRTHTSETSNHRFSNTSHAIYATLPRCREYSHDLRLFDLKDDQRLKNYISMSIQTSRSLKRSKSSTYRKTGDTTRHRS